MRTDRATSAADGSTAPRSSARRPEVLARVAVVVAACIAMTATVRANGGMSTQAVLTSWQLVDLPTLRSDLVGSIWYLQTQPPLFNVLVGGAYSWSPFPALGTLTVVFTALLAGTGLFLVAILRRLGVSCLVAGTATSIAIASPLLLSTVAAVSYEIPVACVVTASVWAAQRHVARPTLASLALVSALLTLGSLTRSLLHPLWLAGFLLIVVAARPLPWRRVIPALMIPVVLLGGVMVKNQVVFGEPTLSSWTGFNLQRGIVAPMRADDVAADIRAGRITPLARQPAWGALGAYGDEAEACRPTVQHPSVTDAEKSADEGLIPSPNFNNTCYLPLYEASSENATNLVRAHPGRYVATRGSALELAFSLPPESGAAAVADTGGPTRSSAWIEAAYRPLLVPVEVQIAQSDWNIPLLGGPAALPIDVSLTLVALYAAAVARSLRSAVDLVGRWVGRRSGVGVRDATWLLVGFSIGWIVVVSSLVELGENGRFRTSLDPLVISLVLAALLTRLPRVRGLTSRCGSS